VSDTTDKIVKKRTIEPEGIDACDEDHDTLTVAPGEFSTIWLALLTAALP